MEISEQQAHEIGENLFPEVQMEDPAKPDGLLAAAEDDGQATMQVSEAAGVDIVVVLSIVLIVLIVGSGVAVHQLKKSAQKK